MRAREREADFWMGRAVEGVLVVELDLEAEGEAFVVEEEDGADVEVVEVEVDDGAGSAVGGSVGVWLGADLVVAMVRIELRHLAGRWYRWATNGEKERAGRGLDVRGRRAKGDLEARSRVVGREAIAGRRMLRRARNAWAGARDGGRGGFENAGLGRRLPAEGEGDERLF